MDLKSEANVVKSELIANLAERKQIPLAKAEACVEVFFESIIESLVRGERAEIRGFGAFSVREYSGYEGRNPKTGEFITVKPKRLPFWKTGQELHQRLNSMPALSKG